jgi:hypothetical protein
LPKWLVRKNQALRNQLENRHQKQHTTFQDLFG